MGCIISKLFPPEPRSPPPNDAIQVKFSSPNVDEPRLRPYDPEPNNRPLTSSPSESPLKPKQSVSIPQEPQSRVQLHTPIYVAVQSYQKTEDTHISVEEGDEL